MAFSDQSRRFWHVDLTTRVGALSAAQQGGLACFIFSFLGALGLLVAGGALGFGTGVGISVLVAGGLEILLALVAAFRLRAGKGAYIGMVVAALMAIEMFGKVLAFSPVGLVIGGVMLVMLVQGVRGALALKRDFPDGSDNADVFA